MTARSPSLARLGVSSALVPRLEALGWVEDGHPRPEAEELLKKIRSGPDPEGTLNRLANLAERDREIALSDLLRLTPLAATSRGLWDCLLRHPEWARGLKPGSDDPRLLVQHRLTEITLADITGATTLEQTARALSDLADRAMALALIRARHEAASRYPEAGEIPLAVIAMGKWGGQELNYASDIDLLFVYRPLGDSEFSRRVALRIVTGVLEQLARPTAEGIAYRVDADLRPEGSTGPLARTVESYRSYYERWGEPWEFQALLKARPAAGDPDLGTEWMEMISPYVWPEVLAPGHVRSLRDLKARAEEHSDPFDIKRAPGGIRDVEFTVQLLQLIHGRGDSQLRAAGTLPTLDALTSGGYVRSEDAAALADSYRWLRTVEHRLQLWQMAQTHVIPADREHLALTLGYRAQSGSASQAFDTDLTRHRRRVRELHEVLYYRPLLEAFASAPAARLTREGAEERLRALGFLDLRAAAFAFEDLTTGLSRRSRLMAQLLPLMLDWLADTPNPDLGLRQLRSLVADNSATNELVSALQDRPLAAQRLCVLLGSSRQVGAFLDRIPEFLPRLADDRLLVELPTGEAIRATALERMQLRPDRPARMASLRRLVRRRMLRIAAADLLELVDLGQVSSSLTDTADAAAGAALWTTEQSNDVPLLVVAMGKWGGQELGYGSDLDLVYVTDTSANGAEAIKLAGDFGAVLGQTTTDGSAYQVDAGLRPEGRQGPLARSLEAFRSYYRDRAAPWERLALIKSRPVAGPVDLAAAFHELAEANAYPVTVSAEAIREIRHIKARVEKERVPAGEDADFHLKLGPGGLSDVEFLVQLWQLRLGHRYPNLRTTSTLQSLPGLIEAGVLTTAEAEDLEEAYRLCTRIRNRLFLQSGRPMDSLPIDQEESARLALLLKFDNRAEMREEYRRVTRRARRIFERKFYSD